MGVTIELPRIVRDTHRLAPTPTTPGAVAGDTDSAGDSGRPKQKARPIPRKVRGTTQNLGLFQRQDNQEPDKDHQPIRFKTGELFA